VTNFSAAGKEERVGDFAVTLLGLFIFLCGVMLILLILVQRGRGGGLVGALGGGGSASPFGSRAGDAFTRYTIVLALIWIALNMIQTLAIQPTPAPRQGNVIGPPGGAPAVPAGTAPTAAREPVVTVPTFPTVPTTTVPATPSPTAPK
jgi:preprotein translocase subunit SecG